MSPCPCLHVHVSMSMSACPGLHVHVSMSMSSLRVSMSMSPCPFLHSVSPCPCLYVHVFMSMSPCPCLHVHVSMSMSPLRVSMSMSSCPCLHSVSPCPCLHVSVSHVYVSMSPCPCLNIHVPMFPEFRKQNSELTKNGNFRLFAANGKWKRQTSVGLLQTETESTEVCFPWSANYKGKYTIAVFSKRAHLCLLDITILKESTKYKRRGSWGHRRGSWGR
jgi:hypothetical protein